MKVENAMVQSAKTKSFSTLINSQNYRAMIDKSVGDPRRAASLVSTLISVVNATPALQECNAGTVISSALRGEIGMNLSLALGDYSIVPYGSRAQFIISANGLKQLAIRSGRYSAIGFFDVREGEYLGRDSRTREPKFQWIEDEDEREKKEIVGYYGFYQLNEAFNHFFQCIYWSHEKILRHADRYSKAFQLKKYEELLAGTLSSYEAEKLQRGSPWYGTPDSLGHRKMCIKTIAKQLLGDGLAPKEIQEVIAVDNLRDESGEPVEYGDEAAMESTMPLEPEVETARDEAAEAPDGGENPPEAPPQPKKETRGRKPKTSAESFFDE